MVTKKDGQREKLKNNVHMQNLASGWILESLRVLGKLVCGSSCTVKVFITSHSTQYVLHKSTMPPHQHKPYIRRTKMKRTDD